MDQDPPRLPLQMPLFFIIINWERSLPLGGGSVKSSWRGWRGWRGNRIEGGYARKTGNADAGVGPKTRHFTEFSPAFPTKLSRPLSLN